MNTNIKVSLSMPEAWDIQNGVRPLVKDQDGNFVCEGFYDDACQERLQLMVDQSNKYQELNAALELLTKRYPGLQSEFQSILGRSEDVVAKSAQELAPYEGLYAYTVDGSDRYEGNFADSGEAIDAATSFIDREWKDGEKVKFTIGMRAHPFDVTYGDKWPVRALGINIYETMGELCGDTIDAGADEYPISLNEDKCEELGQMVVGFMRPNAEVHDYGIMHEIGFTHTSGLNHNDHQAFLKEMADIKSEYVARKNGWQEDSGQIFRVIAGVTDLDAQHIEYANTWQEAVDIDNGLAPMNFESDDDSQRMA